MLIKLNYVCYVHSNIKKIVQIVKSSNKTNFGSTEAETWSNLCIDIINTQSSFTSESGITGR